VKNLITPPLRKCILGIPYEIFVQKLGHFANALHKAAENGALNAGELIFSVKNLCTEEPASLLSAAVVV
jgi:hypothetical protein